jgi:hypothetical protein
LLLLLCNAIIIAWIDDGCLLRAKHRRRRRRHLLLRV